MSHYTIIHSRKIFLIYYYFLTLRSQENNFMSIGSRIFIYLLVLKNIYLFTCAQAQTCIEMDVYKTDKKERKY